MTSPARLAAGLLKVWRSEGPRAASNRTLDRLEERRRRRRFQTLPVNATWTSWSSASPPPVLNLAPLPPVPRRGGSQLQLLARLAAESRVRGVALLYPHGRGWCLEWWDDGRRARVGIPGGHEEVAAVAGRAAAMSLTGAVHLESPHGLPPATAADLSGRGLAVVLGVHDFALFCRRPHLLELPGERFCGFCTDLERCRRCLTVDGSGSPSAQAEHRRMGAAVLAAAAVVVFPSEYLRQCHAELFPGSGSRREWVLAPASGALASAGPATPRPGPPTVALVGGVKPEKGGRLLPELWASLQGKLPGMRGVVVGGGDPELLAPLRRLRGLGVRGYYRAGELPALLAADRAALAVLPSVVPESYSLVVDECLAAGVPVVAFDHGGVAERLRRWGVGRLVDLSAGAPGLAAATAGLLAEGPTPVPAAVRAALPTPESCAAGMLELYRRELP